MGLDGCSLDEAFAFAVATVFAIAGLIRGRDGKMQPFLDGAQGGAARIPRGMLQGAT